MVRSNARKGFVFLQEMGLRAHAAATCLEPAARLRPGRVKDAVIDAATARATDKPQHPTTIGLEVGSSI